VVPTPEAVATAKQPMESKTDVLLYGFLKVPKCEIFDLLDWDFDLMKPL